MHSIILHCYVMLEVTHNNSLFPPLLSPLSALFHLFVSEQKNGIMLRSSLLLFAAPAVLGHLHAVPEDDQCKPVNATEPAACPATIGPPCPPCYSNEVADYKPGDRLAYTDEEKQAITTMSQWYLDWWIAEYPPHKVESGYNVFLGSAGRGNIFLRAYLNTPTNASLLELADEYVNKSLSLLPKKQEHTSFMSGHIGVWFLKAAILKEQNRQSESEEYQQKVVATIANAVTAIKQNETVTADGLSLADSTLDTGLAGMVFGGLLLNAHFSKNIISSEDLAVLGLHLLDDGMATAAKQGSNILMYESFPNCYLWGPGHGSAGIVKMIFNLYEASPTTMSTIVTPGTKYYTVMTNTLSYFLKQQLPDGNIPTNLGGGCAAVYGKDGDSRVQWCHGAPGFMNLFLKAAILYEPFKAAYLQGGISTAQTTWERGLLVKGTMFCHGIGGNVNMFIEAAALMEKLGSPEQRDQMTWRAKQFTLWTLDWDNVKATRLTQSNEGYSMYQGNYAMPMVYVHAGTTTEPRQPGWNVFL